MGDPDGPSVTITGNNPRMAAAYIDQVGIFNSDQTAPKIATITAQTATSITFTVPELRGLVPGRLVRPGAQHGGHDPGRAPTSGRHGPQALPLQVGEGVLSCDVGP